MESFLEIFDVLYEIKDNITDYQFLFLNEKVGELYKLAKENKKNNESEEDLSEEELTEEESDLEEDRNEEGWETEEENIFSPFAREIINVSNANSHRIIIEQSDSSISDESEDSDGNFSIYEDDEMENLNHEDFKQCCKSLETLKLYKNFDEFIKINPILGNLYENVLVEIQIEPDFGDYDRDYFVRNLRNLVKLEYNLDEKNRVYCILAMYNFVMKYAECVKDNKDFGKIMIVKFRKYENDNFLIELLGEISVDRWLESYENILKE